MFTFPARFITPAAVFCAAFALRLMAASVLGDLPISRTPQLDSAAYVSWARALVADPAFWPPYPEHAPGYPIFMAAILAITGGSLTAVRIVQSCLGAIACVLTARIAARSFTPNAYLPAGVLQAAYGPLIYIETALLAESLLVFLLVLALDVATSAHGRARWAAAGALLGLAIIVRPTVAVVPVAFAIAIAIREARRVAIGYAVAMAAGTAIIVAPVVLQNWRVTGLPIVQAYGGMNVYLGNRPSADGLASARPGGEWDALEGEASRAGGARNDQDAYYLQRTFAEVAESPGAYVRLLLSKLVWALQDEELRDTHSYRFFANAMPLLTWLPGFGIMAALAAVAVVHSRGSMPPLLLAYVLATLATVVFLVAGTRYRIPMVPAVIAFAGAGVAGLVDRLRAREWRTAAALAVVVALAFAAAGIRTHAPSRNLAEEHAFTGLSLLQEKNLEAAEAEYRKAISLDDSSFAWDGLGLVLLRRDLRNEARRAFERAVTINDANATAWVHLGLTHEFLENGRAAVAAYQKALSITPQRAEALAALDAALKRYAR